MGKLSTNQRKKVGALCNSANVHNKRRKEVQVYTSSKANGSTVKGILASAYPSYKFYKAEDRGADLAGRIILNALTLGLAEPGMAAAQTWKNFTVECDSPENAQKLVKEIGDCIAEYGDDDETPSAGSDNGGGSDSEEPEAPEKQSTDWTTYVIIGAAALAIVLLLWPKR